MDPNQVFLSLKMHAWADWTDWHQVYLHIFGQNKGPHVTTIDLQKNSPDHLKKALNKINVWLCKNVGSAEHTKALKMQKLILIETLSQKRYR